VPSTPPNTTAEFFRELAAGGNQPLLGRASGTIRFDLADGDRVEHWYVTVKKGDISVSHRNNKADAVVGGDKALFDRITWGHENAMAALLRGAFAAEGDLALLLSFQRVFPGPPEAHDLPAAGYARRVR
jgi:putative sterol carrier protein